MDNKLKEFYIKHSNRGVLTPQNKERIKERVLKSLPSMAKTEASPIRWEYAPGMFYRASILVPLTMVVLLIGISAASAHSLPGDVLYPVKRQMEKARVLFTPTEEKKQELKIRFAEKRLKELEQIQITSPPIPNIIDPEPNNPIPKKNPQSKVELKNKEKAETEAKGAIKFLEKKQEDLKTKGEEKKAEDLDKTIKDYKKKLNLESSAKPEVKFKETKPDSLTKPKSNTPDSKNNKKIED